jgi:hypothetical protein
LMVKKGFNKFHPERGNDRDVVSEITAQGCALISIA